MSVISSKYQKSHDRAREQILTFNFAHESSEVTHLDALSLVLGLICCIVYFTYNAVRIYFLKSKMADQNGRQTANIEGKNMNHVVHHLLSTVLLQEAAKVE